MDPGFFVTLSCFGYANQERRVMGMTERHSA